MITGNCPTCGTKLYQFIKKGKGVINTLLNKIPIPEMHLSLPKDVSSENVEEW